MAICPLPLKTQPFISIRLWLLTLALLITLQPHLLLATEGLDQLREAAVTQAQSGDIEGGITTLNKYLKQHPENIPLRSDLIVLYGWHDENAKATRLYQQRPTALYPGYALTALINSYRALGKSKPALDITNALLARSPDDPVLLLKKSQILIDTGDYAQARILLQKLVDQGTTTPDLFRVQGYLSTSQNKWIEALQHYQDLLGSQPGDREGLDGQVNALIHLNAPFAAAEQMAGQQQRFTPQELAHILKTKAALLLRWSGHGSKTRAEALNYATKALLLQFQAISTLAASPKSTLLQREISYDMVVSLNLLHLYSRSYSLYQHLLATAEVPLYVSRAAAEALLAQRQPQAAKLLLEEILTKNPADHQAKQTLFYAYIENEEFGEAFDLVDNEIAKTPQFRKIQDSSEQIPNDEYLDLVILSGQGRLYADQLAEAWQRITTLTDTAPTNDWLLQVKAETAQAREWPRTAYQFYQQSHLLNPENNDALAGMAQSRLNIQDYTAAESLAQTLQNNYPAANTTAQLQKDLYWAKQPNIWADVEFSYSQGPEQNGDGITATGELISAPINNFLFLSMQTRYDWSEIPEGEESLFRYGGGFELVSQPLSLLALINYNVSTVEEVGGLLRGTWTPDDQWRLQLQGERFSEETPLRALYYGIRQDRVNGSASYRWSESQSASINLSSGWFSDDNQRFEGGATYLHRLIDIPRFDLDALIELSGSTNSRDDAPYYNPEADLSFNGSLKGQQIIWRSYDHVLRHQISGGAGLYEEKNYDTGLTGFLRYELYYSFGPILEVSAGGEIGTNRYDGVNEPYHKFNCMLHAKF